MILPRQLAFALPHAESFAREDFLQGSSNAAALRLIEQWPDWPDRVLALAGPEGAGKSHLAAIWAEIAGARRVSEVERQLARSFRVGHRRQASAFRRLGGRTMAGSSGRPRYIGDCR